MTKDLPPEATELQSPTRAEIEQAGIDSLVVGDLTRNDLAHIAWSGGPLHPLSVEKALERAEQGEVDYLAVRAPYGLPISIGGIDYKIHEGNGYMYQLVTIDDLRGLGIASKLIVVMEERIKQRGVATAMLAVEDNNPEAKRLYERLGYTEYGRESQSWEQLDEDLNPYTYHTEVTLLKKAL